MATAYKLIRTLINLLGHVLIGIHIYMLCWVATHHSGHGWLSGIAIAFCFAEGLLLFCPANYTSMFSPRVLKLLHVIWFGVGGVLIFVGTIIAFVDYRIRSAHSILGLFGVIVIIVSCVFGILLLFNKFKERSIFHKIHFITGLIGYIISMVSLPPAYFRHCDARCVYGYCGHNWQMTVMVISILIITLIAPVQILLNHPPSSLD